VEAYVLSYLLSLPNAGIDAGETATTQAGRKRTTLITKSLFRLASNDLLDCGFESYNSVA
jgi:hypothetical protein